LVSLEISQQNIQQLDSSSETKLTNEEDRLRKTMKKLEKRRRQKKKMKLKHQEALQLKKTQAEEAMILQLERTAIETLHNVRIQTMSEREKRALAAENRIHLANGIIRRCQLCTAPLTMVPFERLDYHYCSMKCLLEHKRLLATNTHTPK